MTIKYNPQQIEKKWQERWEKDRLYEVKEDDTRPKFYALTMFPYTSGDLHIGHWYAMAPSDVHARFKRMQGYNVLHPMGFDAFGLPAENAAIKRGIHPFKWTMQNIENMRRQLRSIGAIYDWSREVVTCLPEYYKWTEWFFLKLYEAGLAYRGKAPVNWCPRCQTVLANEQVVSGGFCERCGAAVTRRDLEQWFFRITKYADELLNFDGIDWPERIRIMQTNWIGKSHGTEISFTLDHPGVEEKEIRVFTTRPDTTFGVTFMVLAPEHPLVPVLTSPEKKAEVEEYIAKSRRLSEIERLSTEKEKDGVFIGAYCLNRLNGEKVPIWIADYVLLSYGTGAVMGVPAHDERDFAFAKKYNLPIRVVVAPPGWQGEELEEAYVEPGIMVNSGQFNGLPSEQGMEAVSVFLEEKGWGKRTVSYRIRDWLISRQRYWGAPIPMIYCEKCGIVPVPEEDLPVLLPEDAEFRPTGESPLKYHEQFVNTTCPRCGAPAKRETDTMDTFMCSSWYFLRYTSPHCDNAPFDADKVKYWMPVDLYTGGAEHAVMHLLYSRFFIKALRDMGLVDFDEPFKRLFNQGIIIAEKQKMSKSRGNVITPDEYVAELGADTVRAYLMFLAPWEQGGEWNDSSISGISRWLNRVWHLVLEGYRQDEKVNLDTTKKAERELSRFTHQTIKRVTEDLERLHFNTMISSLMEFTNYLGKVKESAAVTSPAWEEAINILLRLLAPTAPHLAEELWERTGGEYSIHNQRWPEWDAELARAEEITLVVQVNGKLRDRITVPVSITEDEAKQLALQSQRVKPHLDGKELAKIIYVPGRLINLVAR
ncbi:MAG TPA: leucine--tRNA ligase [Dehalococcoidia bacterium]|nr:leucine--tRNA ligase [Dehalococcoidia bacterium]